MKSTDPLVVAWEETLRRAGDRAAIVAANGDVLQTFDEIESRACALKEKIQIFGRGSVVAIQIGNHHDWPAIFIACLRQELVVLPLERSISESQRDAALETCHASVLVANASDHEIEIRRLRKTTEAVNWQENQPSLLKLTSGTTAAPRAIRFRSKQLLADCDQICETMGISEADLNFGVIPISHSYGFSNLLTPLIARGVPLVLSEDRTPRAVLADLARTKATVLPAMPVFFQSFCEMEKAPTLPNLRLCISAGAPLLISIAKNFREKFGLPIHSFYGASECGGICYDREGKGEIDGFVGSAMKNIDLEMVDPGSDSSQVRVRSAAAGDGYFPEPEPSKLDRRIFIPDDLLYECGGGFKVVGRISDVINVAGKKVNPAEIEAHLRDCRGVREAIVFGRKSDRRNEEVAACVAADPNVGEGELLEFLRGRLSSWQVPKRIFLVDKIPVNERGKVSRRELATRFSR